MLYCIILVGTGAYYARRWLLLWDPSTEISQLWGENDVCDVVEELLMTETIESTMEATEGGDMLI